VSEGEGDTLRAGGNDNDIDPLAAVVGKGWAKDKGAIPVRGPSVAVFGTGEGKTELARRVDRVGGEIIVEEGHACSDSYQVRHAKGTRDTR
jgi:hypothetical protein